MSRDSGRKLYKHLGKDDTPVNARRRPTEVQRRAKGEKWKHSDDKKFYGMPDDWSYDEVEQAWTPYKMNLDNIKLGNLRLPRGAEELGEFPWPCRCLGEVGRPTTIPRETGCSGFQYLGISAEGMSSEPSMFGNGGYADSITVGGSTKLNVYYPGKDVTAEVIRTADASFWAAVANGTLPDPRRGTRYICNDDTIDCMQTQYRFNPDCRDCQERSINIVSPLGESHEVSLIPSGGDCNTATVTVSGSAEVNASSTANYTLSGALGGVVWSVSGTGVTIDENGLLTASASACGKAIITGTDCCGNTDDLEVYLISANSYWAAPVTICDYPGGSSACTCTKYISDVKYEISYDPDVSLLGPCSPCNCSENCPECDDLGYDIEFINTSAWVDAC